MPTSASLTRWGPFTALALACLIVVAAAHQGSLANSLHLEDAQIVGQNPAIRSLANVSRFFSEPSSYSIAAGPGVYRPLVTLSLALDFWWGGGAIRAFHLGQLGLLLTLGAALAFLYLRLMNLSAPGPSNRSLALVAATWFCVHVANTETLNVMAARADILAGLGIATGLGLYLGSARARRRGLYLLPVGLGALGSSLALWFGPLLFVLVLLAQQRWYAGAPAAAKARRALRIAVPALVGGLGLYWLLGALAGKAAEPTLAARLDHAIAQPWSWLHYLRLFVLPAGLSVQSDQVITSAHDTRVVSGLVAVVTLGALAWRCARTRAGWPIAFGLAWFAITLLPSSSVVPQAEAISERRVFVPYIGLVLAAVWAARLAVPWLGARLALAPSSHRTLAVGLGALVIGGHAVGAGLRHRVWLTEESLWADATKKCPQQAAAWLSYGLALMARNELAGARGAFERALALWPGSVALEINLGIVHGALGAQAEAEAHFRRALVLGPREHLSHYYYGRWLLERGRGPEALVQLEQASQLAPGDAASHGLVMDLLAARGDASGAAKAARAWLSVHPEDAHAKAHAAGVSPLSLSPPTPETYLAFGLEQLKRDSSALPAVLAYREVVRLRPSSAEALNDVGFALCKLGFFAEAVPVLKAALELRPDLALVRNNLAWATAEQSRREPSPVPQGAPVFGTGPANRPVADRPVAN